MKLRCLIAILSCFISHVSCAGYPESYEECCRTLVDYVGKEIQNSTNETVVATDKLLLQELEAGSLTEDQLRTYMRGELGISPLGMNLAALEWFRKGDYDLKALEPLLESSSALDQRLGYLILRFAEPSEEKLQILRNQLANLISSKIVSGERSGGYILHEIGSCYATFVIVDNPIREKVSQEIRQNQYSSSFGLGVLNELITMLDYEGTCIDIETRILMESAIVQLPDASLLDDYLDKIGKAKHNRILDKSFLDDLKMNSQKMVEVADAHMHDECILQPNDSFFTNEGVSPMK